MPVIKQYFSEIAANPGFAAQGRQATAADFGSQMGDAMADMGGQLEQRARQDDVANVRAAMAKARAEWTVEFQKRATNAKPGDITFAETFNRDFNDYLAKGREVAYTRDGQRTYDLLASEIGGHFAEKAGLFQAQSVGAKAKLDHGVELSHYASALISDPTQYGQVLAQAEAALNDPNGRYAGIPGQARAELAVAQKDALAKAYIQGLVNNGAPELARRLLMEGKLDTELDPNHKETLIKLADVGVKAKQSAAEHADLLKKREAHDRSEKAYDDFLKTIIDPKNNPGNASDAAIMANPDLTPEKKRSLVEYKLQRARELAALGEHRTNPGAVRELMMQIHAADNDPKKTYNMDPVMEAYGKGKISTSEMLLLRKEVTDMKDGATQGFGKDVQNARNAVFTMLSRSVMGQTQPEVAADAAYRFTMDLNKRIEEKRKANEDPRVLLDPQSKDYMLSPGRIQTYMGFSRNMLAGQAQAIRESQKQLPNSGAAAPAVASYKDYDKLPKGAQFTDPQGNVRVKP